MTATPYLPAMSEDAIAALARGAVADLAARLAQRAFRPLAEPAEAGDGVVEGDALASLHVLMHLQRAVAREMDEAVARAVEQGAGYPQLGKACSITRQGARKRWPGVVPAVQATVRTERTASRPGPSRDVGVARAAGSGGADARDAAPVSASGAGRMRPR